MSVKLSLFGVCIATAWLGGSPVGGMPAAPAADAQYQLTVPAAGSKDASQTALEIQALIDQGVADIEQGNTDTARETLTTALTLSQTRNHPELGIKAVNALYPLLTADPQQAAQILEQGIRFAQSANDLASEAQYLVELQDIYFEANDFEALLQAAERFEAITSPLNQPELQLISQAMYLAAYSVSGDFEAVYRYADQVLALTEQLFPGDAEQRLTVLEAIFFAYDKLPDYERGLSILTEMIALTQTLGDIPRESRYQMVAGKYHEAINQFEAAIAASQIAIDLAREANLPEIEIAALATLGDVYDQQGNYTEAITTAEIVLDRSRQANDSTWRSDALSTLASAHSSLNNYDQAISYAEESLQIAQTENDHGVMIEALATLYGVYLDLGDFEQAAQLADRVTQTVNDNNPSSQNTARFVETFDGLIDAINAFVAGDYPLTVRASETALASLEEITLADNIKAQFSALMYLFAGIGYSGLDQHAAAIENVSNGLDIFRDSEYAAADATAAFMAGNVYYRAGDLDTALSLYTEALAIEPDSHYVEAGIARLYRDRGLPNVAISHYKQAVNQVEQVRGNVRNLSSNLEESFFDAFVSIDGLRIADIYRELADLLLTQGRIAEAQQVLELLKLEELREFEGTERSGQQSDLTLNTTEAQIIDEYGSLIAFGQEVLACQQSRCSDLSQLLDRRDALTAQFNTTLTTLEADIRERLSVDRGALDTQDFRKSAAAVVEAQPNSLLIYPLILEDKLWLLWAAEGGVLKSVEINAVGQRDLSQAILQFRQLIETPNSNISEIKAVGQQLYDWLLAPLEGEIEANNIENLVFALDRTTRYLPMGALFDGETYLIEKYTVSTILSAGETDMVDRLPAAEQTSILAMGLSDSVEGFSALPNVPVELASIVIETDDAADETGIYQGQLFLNQNFDRRTLRDNLSYHAVAHIATHAEFVPGSHEDSYLLLGTGEQLKISDIQALQDLNNTHLIVLSACETALSGPDQDGIEISGVAHQFLEGGAKAVMASLWKVNDASTSVLMQLFYQQLAAGTGEQPVTKAEALRQAQLTLLNDEEDIQLALANLSRSGERFGGFDNTFRARRPDQGYRHPYYWAPFVLIGNNL